MEPNEETSANQTQFFHDSYRRAYYLSLDGKHDVADDICRELIADFTRPRLLQVHAWQLRSHCTNVYFDAKSHLNQALALLKRIPEELHLNLKPEDGTAGVVIEMANYTSLLIDDLDRVWRDDWQKKGKAAPMTEDELKIEENASIAADRAREIEVTTPQGLPGQRIAGAAVRGRTGITTPTESQDDEMAGGISSMNLGMSLRTSLTGEVDRFFDASANMPTPKTFERGRRNDGRSSPPEQPSPSPVKKQLPHKDVEMEDVGSADRADEEMEDS